MKSPSGGFLLCLILLLSAEKVLNSASGQNFLAPQSEVARGGQEILDAIREDLSQLGKDWDSRWAAVDRIEEHVKLTTAEGVALEIIREVAPWLKHEKTDVRGAAVLILETVAKTVPTDLVRQEIVGLLEPHLQDESQTVRRAVAWAMAAIERSLVSQRIAISQNTPERMEGGGQPRFAAVRTTQMQGETLAGVDFLLRRLARLLPEEEHPTSASAWLEEFVFLEEML